MLSMGKLHSWVIGERLHITVLGTVTESVKVQQLITLLVVVT